MISPAFRPKKNGSPILRNAKTRRAYKNDVHEFITYTGLKSYAELRSVVSSHIIDWRKDIERRKL